MDGDAILCKMQKKKHFLHIVFTIVSVVLHKMKTKGTKSYVVTCYCMGRSVSICLDIQFITKKVHIVQEWDIIRLVHLIICLVIDRGPLAIISYIFSLFIII